MERVCFSWMDRKKETITRKGIAFSPFSFFFILILILFLILFFSYSHSHSWTKVVRVKISWKPKNECHLPKQIASHRSVNLFYTSSDKLTCYCHWKVIFSFTSRYWLSRVFIWIFTLKMNKMFLVMTLAYGTFSCISLHLFPLVTE